jgi:trigger factor
MLYNKEVFLRGGTKMDNKHEIIVKIEKGDWQKALNKSFEKNIKKVKIDGFRQGKAPREIYEKKFGKESLYMDAVDIVLPDAYKKAIEDNKLKPVAQPDVKINKIDDEGAEILFTIITKPKLKIKKYKGLKVEKPSYKVTKEEIEESIESLQKKYAEIVLKEEPISSGDTAVIDFEGFKGGKKFEGGKGENYPLEIGSNTFIPGFEDQLIGLKAGEETEINLTFPEDYPSDELKGQEVTFKVKINEVKTKAIPELNDDFFKDLGKEDVHNKEELYKSLEKELEEQKEFDADNKFIDNILDAVSKQVEVIIPEEMIDDEIHHMIHQYEERLAMQGLTIEQYYQMTGTSHEKLHEQLEEEAKKVILYRLMIEEIAKLEKIEATEEEVKEELSKLAIRYQMDEKELVEAFGGMEMVKYDVEMKKALAFLKENNKQK